MEKTDGCQMYLSAESLDVEIVSAKSSEMNVVIPSGEDFVSFKKLQWGSEYVWYFNGQK